MSVMPSRHSSLVQVQLGRVLKYGGAGRLSQGVESISHVVHSVSTTTVLPHTTKLLASLPDLSPHQVSVQWLAESFRLGRPAPESDFNFPAVTGREDPALRRGFCLCPSPPGCRSLTVSVWPKV